MGRRVYTRKIVERTRGSYLSGLNDPIYVHNTDPATYRVRRKPQRCKESCRHGYGWIRIVFPNARAETLSRIHVQTGVPFGWIDSPGADAKSPCCCYPQPWSPEQRVRGRWLKHRMAVTVERHEYGRSGLVSKPPRTRLLGTVVSLPRPQQVRSPGKGDIFVWYLRRRTDGKVERTQTGRKDVHRVDPRVPWPHPAVHSTEHIEVVEPLVIPSRPVLEVGGPT